MQKTTVHQALTEVLVQKHEELTAIRLEASDGKSNDAKSSAFKIVPNNQVDKNLEFVKVTV